MEKTQCLRKKQQIQLAFLYNIFYEPTVLSFFPWLGSPKAQLPTPCPCNSNAYTPQAIISYINSLLQGVYQMCTTQPWQHGAWVGVGVEVHIAVVMFIQEKKNLNPSSDHGCFSVVSRGSFNAFYVDFFPLEYIPSIPPHSTYVIVNGFIGFKIKSAHII